MIFEKLKIIFFAIVIFMVNISCEEKSYSPDTYIDFIEKSGDKVLKKRSYDDTDFDLKYEPPAYLAARQIEESPNGQFSFDNLCDSYKKSSHYILRIENTLGKPVVRGMVKSIEEYQDLVQYMAFSLKEDVRLYTDMDTIPCQFTHFERNYDLAPFAQVHLGFALPDEHFFEKKGVEDWVVEFDAHRLGLGPIKFRFQNTADIHNPTIVF